MLAQQENAKTSNNCKMKETNFEQIYLFLLDVDERGRLLEKLCFNHHVKPLCKKLLCQQRCCEREKGVSNVAPIIRWETGIGDEMKYRAFPSLKE